MVCFFFLLVVLARGMNLFERDRVGFFFSVGCIRRVACSRLG